VALSALHVGQLRGDRLQFMTCPRLHRKCVAELRMETRFRALLP